MLRCHVVREFAHALKPLDIHHQCSFGNPEVVTWIVQLGLLDVSRVRVCCHLDSQLAHFMIRYVWHHVQGAHTAKYMATSSALAGLGSHLRLSLYQLRLEALGLRNEGESDSTSLDLWSYIPLVVLSCGRLAKKCLSVSFISYRTAQRAVAGTRLQGITAFSLSLLALLGPELLYKEATGVNG